MARAQDQHQRRGIRNGNQNRRGGNNRRLINMQFGLGALERDGHNEVSCDAWLMTLQPILLQSVHTPGAPDLAAELRGVSRLVAVLSVHPEPGKVQEPAPAALAVRVASRIFPGIEAKHVICRV